MLLGGILQPPRLLQISHALADAGLPTRQPRHSVRVGVQIAFTHLDFVSVFFHSHHPAMKLRGQFLNRLDVPETRMVCSNDEILSTKIGVEVLHMSNDGQQFPSSSAIKLLCVVELLTCIGDHTFHEVSFIIRL